MLHVLHYIGNFCLHFNILPLPNSIYFLKYELILLHLFGAIKAVEMYSPTMSPGQRIV